MNSKFMQPMSTIGCKTSDGVIFNVEVEVASKSILLKEMMKFWELASKDNIINLAHVDSEIFRKLIQWMTYHKKEEYDEEDPEDIDPEDSIDLELSSWDTEFFNVDARTLFKIAEASNYLNIPDLHYSACKMIVKKVIIEETEKDIIWAFAQLPEYVED